MNNSFYKLTCLLLLPLLLASCAKKITESNNDPCKGIMCTMMFAMVNTSITDNAGNPVKLDSFYTLRASTGEKIYHENNGLLSNSYTVLDDGYHRQLINTRDSFYFIGYYKGTKAVNELYIIGADCCHISKQSGENAIVIP